MNAAARLSHGAPPTRRRWSASLDSSRGSQVPGLSERMRARERLVVCSGDASLTGLFGRVLTMAGLSIPLRR